MEQKGLLAAILQAHNVKRVAALDFETYFDAQYSLKKMTTTAYVRHDLFKVHCVAIRLLPDWDETYTFTGDEAYKVLTQLPWQSTALLAHHAQFDGLILSHHYNVMPAYNFCSLSMARPSLGRHIRNDLNTVAKHFGVGNKLPDILDETKGVRELPDDLLQDLADYNCVDVDIMCDVFDKLLPMFTPEELDLIDLTIKAYTRPMLRVDLEHARQCLEDERVTRAAVLNGVAEPVARATVGLWPRVSGATERTRKGLRSREVFAKLLRDEGVEPPTKTSPANGKETYAFAKSDLAFQALQGHSNPRVRALVEAKLISSSTLAETRPQRLIDHSGEYDLPVYLRYWGAHTGRWSGGDKINLQNLPRDGKIRKCITAPPGSKLVVVDSAQIEARVLAWLAEELPLLEAFRDAARSPYREMGAKLYGCELDAVTDSQRFVGKVVTLGAGYQMGANRFAHMLRAGLMGPPVDISDSDAEHTIRTYRQEVPEIKRLWGTMGRMLAYLAGKPLEPPTAAFASQCADDTPWVIMREDKPVLTFRKGAVDMPNNMRLLYPRLHYYDDAETGDGYYRFKSQNGHTAIYGGKLTENVVQALARTIVAYQALRVSRDYPIVLLVYDEVVLCVPDTQAEQALSDLVAAMSEPLDWCTTLPVEAEGAIMDYYGKP